MKSISLGLEGAAMHTEYLETYNFVKKGGLLPRRNWEVYHHLFKHGPCSASDLSFHYKKISRNHISARIGELVKMGMVRKVGTKQSVHSGRASSVWSITKRKIPRSFRKHLRTFWLNVYDDKIEVFKSKEEANSSAGEGLVEFVMAKEVR